MAIVTANLQCNLDSTNIASNTGTGNTWFDLSANNLDFTGTGTSRISFAGIDCFDLGTGKYFTGPNNLSTVIDWDTDWTVELWINYSGSQLGSYNSPWGTGFSYSPPFASGVRIETATSTGSRAYFGYGSGSYEITTYPATTLTLPGDATTIHQLVVRKSSGTIQFLLDGAPSYSLSGIANTISLLSDPFFIGYGGYYDPMVGKVAALRAYDVALTNAEVLQNYYSGPTATVITEFDFSDTNTYSGSGSTVYDISGFGNYGLITGATFAGSGTSKYFEFTGTNDNIYSPVTLLPNASNPVWTENIWFQAEPGSDKIIYCYGTNPPTSNSGTTILAYGFSGIHGGNFFYEAGSGADRINLGFGATSGVWNNLVLSASGTTVSAYFAGSFITSGPQTESILAPKYMNFSGLSNVTSAPSGYMFDGKIAIFRVYNYAQTAGEISSQFAIDNARFNPTPPVPAVIASWDASDAASYSGSGNTWTDLSGNGNNLVGASSWSYTAKDTTPNPLGWTNPGYFTNAASNRMLCTANNYLKFSSTGTIQGWFYNNNAYGVPLSFPYTGNFPSYWMQAYANKPGANFLVDATFRNFDPGGSVLNLQWFNWAIVFDNGVADLYVNGTYVSSNDQSAFGTSIFYNPSDTTLVVGDIDNSGPNYPFVGNIGEIKMYSTALSAGDILTNYNDTLYKYDGNAAPPGPPTPYIGQVGGRTFGQGFAG